MARAGIYHLPTKTWLARGREEAAANDSPPFLFRDSPGSGIMGDKVPTTYGACGISPACFPRVRREIRGPDEVERESPPSPAGPRPRHSGEALFENANQRSTPSDLDAERRYTTHKRFARPLYLSKSSPPAGADLSSHRGLAPTQLTRASASTPPHPPGRNLRREVRREVRREASRCPTP